MVFAIVCGIVYVRSLTTNCIFDEQEALLANPYVNGDTLGFLDAFRRDFWGLPYTRSIGSYRPIPDIVWRLLWRIHEHPWLPHAVNMVVHAVNASLVSQFVWRWTRNHAWGWFSGATFLLAAVITEAVCGVVGLADVLGGMGILLALVSLTLPLPSMPLAVFGAVLLGMFSKESTLTAPVLVGMAAWLSAPALHGTTPRRWLRSMSAALSATVAVVIYTYTRRELFPAKASVELDEPLRAGATLAERAMRGFLGWFRQPQLPRDPINNPLIDADFPHRVAGGLRVYAEGIGQVLFPYPLSGDYSYPQEPIPDALVFPGSVLGALGFVVPLALGAALVVLALQRDRRAPSGGAARHAVWALLGLALLWIPLSYFPHSNIAKLLPTVRAERFWYVPAIGTSILIGYAMARLTTERRTARWGWWAALAFLSLQAASARWHAFDYADDLAFWRATAHASTRSAKAHLNYGVMLGAQSGGASVLAQLIPWVADPSAEDTERARQEALEARLAANARALELAPEWPMAQIYHGDVLCRMQRMEEAWQHYRKGFELGPNEQSLIALALQCLWDYEEDGKKGNQIALHEKELLELAEKHPSSWLDYLAREAVYRGEEHDGVEARYRPRSYNSGPDNADE